MAMFDDHKTEFTQNQNNLRIVDGRLSSMRGQNPGSSEIARFEFIREDILKNMSQEEKDIYIQVTTTKLTQAQIKANNEAMLKQMNENRDSPSI